MLNRPDIFNLRKMDITIRLITNEHGYKRYCVNQAEAARLLGVTAPAINDKISRGTMVYWRDSDKKWIPIDVILPYLDYHKQPEELQILIDAGVFHYNPLEACFEMLLKTKKISWDDLDLETQKIYLQKK